MLTVINQNVPICPVCKASMHKRFCMFGIHYVCDDCKKIFRVLDYHKSDCELVVTDNNDEALAYLGGNDA